jgi:hypothetical protein
VKSCLNGKGWGIFGGGERGILGLSRVLGIPRFGGELMGWIGLFNWNSGRGSDQGKRSPVLR